MTIVNAKLYVYMYIFNTCVYIYIYIWSGVWRSQPPPPPWYGLVRGGGGAGVCGERWGPLKLQLEKRPGVTDKAGIVRKPYASHKSYNVAQ